MTTFAGDFQQIVFQNGDLVQESTGTVKLKKPLNFFWDYKTPEPMQLISNNKDFYHYDIELAQATKKPVSDVADSSLALLLKGDNSIDNTFTVKKIKQSEIEKTFSQLIEINSILFRANTFYLLTPKKKSNSDFQAEKIIIGTNMNGLLTVFFAEDAYGKNIFLFDNVKQNENISDDVFEFTAPKGVDVVTQVITL